MNEEKSKENFRKILKNIKNPLVKRALESRERDFMFRGILWHEEKYNESSDHQDHKHHTDGTKYADYSERSGHSDYSSKGRKSSSHTDKTWHEDYTQYSESIYLDTGY